MGTLVLIIKGMIIFITIFSLIMWINWNVKVIAEKHHSQQTINWGGMLALFITIGYFMFKL